MIKIRPLSFEDFNKVIDFANEYIGKNYFSQKDLERILQLSSKNNQVSSLLAFAGENLVAIRLSFMPGNWQVDDAMEIREDLWPYSLQEMGYFKSLFVSSELQGKGLGIKLSRKSLEILKSQGAKGVVTHSWMQSPGNSSYKYLKKLGFEDIRDVPNAWSHIDYDCVVCAPSRCYCSAKEMVLKLEKP